MTHWHPPTLDELLYESEHKRSLHPTLSNGEVLDTLKQYLENDENTGISHVQQLIVLKRKAGPFRLPNGQFCHYAKTPKVMSTSISTALARAIPWLWIGANKFWSAQRGNAEEFIKRRYTAKQSNTPIYHFSSGGIYANPRNPIERPLTVKPPLKQEPFRRYTATKFRFCILRDPIERFVSAWAYHPAPRMKKMSERRDPEEFLHAISHPDTRKKHWNIHHVAQSHFLGNDPSYYTHIFSMRNVARLEEFLSDICDEPVTIPHENRGRKRQKMLKEHGLDNGIPASLRQRIEAHYAQDYKIWGKYF